MLAGLAAAAAVAYVRAGQAVLRVRAGSVGGGRPRVVASAQETIQTTGIVFVFVVIMALFLFAVDSSLASVVELMTGRSAG